MDDGTERGGSPAPVAKGAGAPAKAEMDRAFEELYRTHLRDVYSYSYYRVGNHHDAEDLTEQAFLQAYRHFERARGEHRGVRAAVASPRNRAGGGGPRGAARGDGAPRAAARRPARGSDHALR